MYNVICIFLPVWKSVRAWKGRRSGMKTALRRIAVLLLLLLMLPLDSLAAAKLRSYSENAPTKAQRYQYVQLGTYPYEADGTVKPVLWKVLYVENDQALLFSDLILDKQQVVYAKTREIQLKRKFRRVKDYTETDLYTWMNKTMLKTLLGKDDMRKALVETQYGKLYPLTDEQLMTPAYGFSSQRYWAHPEKRTKATPYAKEGSLYSWSRKLSVDAKFGTSPYWVVAFRNPEKMDKNYMMQLCGGNGHLSYGSYARVDVGVRPALTLDLTKCKIASGKGTRSKPYVLKYVAPKTEEKTEGTK